ncbi:NADH:ubiquinone oxidoreductase [Rhodobacter calidifons]|uniref:NADH:ubiquinone oxidoreductase n=1 Tax=Rhodobacter calidifons TaxID=2715277 RepID=UPI001A985D20|nr:NADH:ubiquinone oxidoreductase [Rhodobacter calidifons]
MRSAENLNAPWLGGWIIGAAAGLVAFAALIIIGKFDYTPAAAIGIVVALLAGMILGMPWGAGPSGPVAQASGAAAAAAAAAPVPAAPVAAQGPAAAPATPAAFAAMPAEAHAGPERLSAPRGGKADDLKEIEGIGPALEKLVNELGFYHFAQIASWTEDDVAWVDANLKGFKGRVTRDKWVAQAKIIVTEGLEAFRERAKTNNY